MGNDLRALLSKSKASHFARQKGDSVDPVVGESAFVGVSEADCRYEPRDGAAISMSPPFGTKVFVETTRDDWLLIKVFAKKAWTKRQNISRNPPAPIPEWLAQVEGQIRESPMDDISVLIQTDQSKVEVGPRGGRYTLGKGGYRRYF